VTDTIHEGVDNYRGAATEKKNEAREIFEKDREEGRYLGEKWRDRKTTRKKPSRSQRKKRCDRKKISALKESGEEKTKAKRRVHETPPKKNGAGGRERFPGKSFPTDHRVPAHPVKRQKNRKNEYREDEDKVKRRGTTS